MPRYNTAEIFWSKCDKAKESFCWNWTGGTDKDGYGKIHFEKQHWRAHRLSFFLTYNERPIFVCHKCDNPSCINPDHLFAGDPKTNNSDRQQKGRNADLSNENHPMMKFDNRKIKKARAMRQQGYSVKYISKNIGISCSYLFQIFSGKNRCMK